MDVAAQKWRALGLCLPLILGMGAMDATAREAPPLEQLALISPQAARAVMLGLTRAGERLVAVGERGIVLYSDDNGIGWQQARVPVSVTLTSIIFTSPSQGWAAGHNGVLLRSDDAGATWQRVLDRRDVVLLHQRAAEQLATQRGQDDDRARLARRQAEQLATDERDSPWLDLSMDAQGRLWLAGAYGVLMRSNDGQQWEAWSSHLGNIDRHLYAVKVWEGQVVIVGEQGLLLRSIDDGENFQALDLPYEGSMFTLQLGADGMVLAGLRGNGFRSSDGGNSFTPLALPAPVSLTASLRMPDQSILLADQAGGLYRLAGGALSRVGTAPVGNPSALALAADGGLVVSGSQGAARVAGLSIESVTP